MTGSDEQFMQRWARRKQAEREKAIKEAAPEPEAEPITPPAPIAPEDLPDIDSLEKDSDYTPFLQDGVPEELKRLALRALWRSDPVLANLDGLNDYDEDFGATLKLGAETLRRWAEASAESEDGGADPTPSDSAETGIAEMESESDKAAAAESDDTEENDTGSGNPNS